MSVFILSVHIDVFGKYISDKLLL